MQTKTTNSASIRHRAGRTEWSDAEGVKKASMKQYMLLVFRLVLFLLRQSVQGSTIGRASKLRQS